jgi:hypothetical protein
VDVNPLILAADGATAVDALVVLASAGSTEPETGVGLRRRRERPS